VRLEQGEMDEERRAEVEDQYQGQFLPKAISTRRALMQLVPYPARTELNEVQMRHREWWEIAEELNTLAAMLPDGPCTAADGSVANSKP
jgi:hypothetical protein